MAGHLFRAVLFDKTGSLVSRRAVLITDSDGRPVATLQSGDGGLVSARFPSSVRPKLLLRLAGIDPSEAIDISELVTADGEAYPEVIPPLVVPLPEAAFDVDELPVEIGFRRDIDHYERSANLASLKCEPLIPNRAPARRFRFSEIVTKPTPFREELIGSLVGDLRVPTQLLSASIIDYETIWTPIDQVLGEPVHSVSLAPCEQTRIAVVNWSRDDSGSLGESSQVGESLSHQLNRDRQIEDVLNATINEWQSGNSLQGGTAGVLGGNFGMFSFTNSHSGGYASNSTRGRRNIAVQGVDRLQDSVVQAASAVRSRYGTVVKDATQNEYDFAQTRVIRNHNHCHMLNVLYHEVLQRYEIRTRFIRARDALVVVFGTRCFEYLSPTDSDPSPDPSASTIIVSPRELYARRQQIIPNLIDKDLIECFDALERGLCIRDAVHVRRTGSFAESLLVEESILVLNVLSNFQSVPRVNLVTASGEKIELLVQNPPEPPEIVRRGEEPPPLLNPGSTYRFRVLPARLVAWTDIVGLELVTFRPDDQPEPRISRLELQTEVQGVTWSVFGRQVDLVPSESESRSGDGSRAVAGEVLTYGPFETTDLPNAPFVLLSQEDFCCVRRLIDHLNYNKQYYTAVLVGTMSPHERGQFLQSIPFSPELVGAEPDATGTVFDFVVNEPVGINGSELVFPLRDITVFSDTLRIDECEDARRTIALPTRGVQAVGQLGDCNLCEEIDPTRFWRWSEEPCPDNAPEIMPVSLGSRNQTPSLNSAPAAEANLSVEAAPEAPEPGSFLNGVLDVLKTPDIFDDLSGKEELNKLLTELVKAAADVEKTRLSQAGNSSSDDSSDSESVEDQSPSSPRVVAEPRPTQRNETRENSPEDIAVRARAIRSAVRNEDRADQLVDEMVEDSNARLRATPDTVRVPRATRVTDPTTFFDTTAYGAVDWNGVAQVFDNEERLIQSKAILRGEVPTLNIPRGESGVIQMNIRVTVANQPAPEALRSLIGINRVPGGDGHQTLFQANWSFEPSSTAETIVLSTPVRTNRTVIGAVGGFSGIVTPVFSGLATATPSNPSDAPIRSVSQRISLSEGRVGVLDRTFSANIQHFDAPPE